MWSPYEALLAEASAFGPVVELASTAGVDSLFPGRTHTAQHHVDTDFADCRRTRRSTSGGGGIMRGSHLLQHWTSTQSTVALSSAEAKLTGICRGAAKGIGRKS